MTTELAPLPIPTTGLSTDSIQKLKDAYTPLWEKAQLAINAAPQDRVTDATDVTGIKRARESRLAIRQARIETEKTRKTMKEDVLLLTKAIDGPAKVINDICEGHEARLQEDEDFATRAEAARKAHLKTERAAMLAPFGINTEMMTLGELTNAEFEAFYNTTKAGFEAQQAAARKAEADRLEAARLAAEEDARVRAENARLKAEADAAAKALAEQRAKADAEARAAKKAAAAPDAEKIRAIAAALLAVPMPTVSADNAEKIENIRLAVKALADRVIATAKAIAE